MERKIWFKLLLGGKYSVVTNSFSAEVLKVFVSLPPFLELGFVRKNMEITKTYKSTKLRISLKSYICPLFLPFTFWRKTRQIWQTIWKISFPVFSFTVQFRQMMWKKYYKNISSFTLVHFVLAPRYILKGTGFVGTFQNFSAI